MKRLFIGSEVCFNDDNLKIINEIKNKLNYEQIVWVNNEITHLTLCFLGQTPDSKIDAIKQIMNNCMKNISKFSLQLNKIGVFGSKYAPTVIWAGFENFQEYKNIYDSLTIQLSESNIEFAKSNFVPHITIGRIKKIDDKKNFWSIIENNKNKITQSVEIKKITLFQSKLTLSGPIYRPLYTQSLITLFSHTKE